MKEWLLANGITHVAMESTGVEFEKLGGYKVSLEKNEATKTWDNTILGRFLL